MKLIGFLAAMITPLYAQFMQSTALRTQPANAFQVACWGDSLTSGNSFANPGNAVNYPNVLATTSTLAAYNGGVGGDTSTQILTRFLAVPNSFPLKLIIWSGRNNFATPLVVKADIASMIATAGHTRYVVLAIINGNFPGESVGQANYITLTTLNSDLGTLYGSRYLDIRAYLVSLYNPALPQDVIDHGNDVPPSSLREAPTKSVTGITRASATATVAQTAHGYSSNDYILITGSDQTEYNGLHQITKTSDDAYTYAVSGTPATPATGTLTAGFVDQIHLNAAGYTAVANYIYANAPSIFQ